MRSFITFVIGATIGVAVSRWYFEKKYRKMAEEEIESVKRAFSYQDKKTEKENGEKDGDSNIQNGNKSWSSLDLDGGQKKTDSGVRFEKKYEDDDYTYYTAYSKDETTEHPKDDVPDEEDADYPREITENEYITGIKYKKKEFTYYTDDDTFVNYTLDQSNDEEYNEPIVDDEHNYFGDVIDQSDFKFDDNKQVIFIRNYENGFDCKVEKYRGRYTE